MQSTDAEHWGSPSSSRVTAEQVCLKAVSTGDLVLGDFLDHCGNTAGNQVLSSLCGIEYEMSQATKAKVA